MVMVDKSTLRDFMRLGGEVKFYTLVF